MILLTARTEEVDRIIGFTAGSDDYVTKPFSARELALRARAILRRAEIPGQDAEDRALRFDGLVIDPDTRTVTVGAGLTPELSALDFGRRFPRCPLRRDPAVPHSCRGRAVTPCGRSLSCCSASSGSCSP